MKVVTTSLPGVLLLEPTAHRDERGFFVRTFDAATAREAGLDHAAFVQDSQSRSRLGALRGLHLRRGSGEAKLVRCASGAIYDVVVDLRPASATFRRWEAFRLDDTDHRVLYVPRGFGHGWQALTDPADVCYRIDAEHDPSEDVTVAYDDAELGVTWPLPVSVMSERDRTAPALSEVLPLLTG
ncbi:MAG: dTDP-4-dehydrorhamnose 3,5-epimerase [Actinomycetes bacterium]